MVIDSEKPMQITHAAVKLVMLVAIVDNIVYASKINLLTDRKMLLNIAYSAVLGRRQPISIEEVLKLDFYTIKKILNRVIIYTYTPKQTIWDYAEWVSYNKKNLFSTVFSDLVLLNKNALKNVQFN